jgi:alpha-mannosidase
VPAIAFASTEDYYGDIEAGGYRLPERSGEMNFVFDGCYTTHADVKRGNRLCEQKLQAVEALCLMAGEYGFEYPAERLVALWKRTLFNQFHDILDGSGVKDTYRFTSKEYEDILSQLGEIEEAATALIAVRTGFGESSFIALNPSGFEADGTVRVKAEAGKRCRAAGPNGEVYPCQTEGGEAVVSLKGVPANGALAFRLEEDTSPAPGPFVTDAGKYYRVDTRYYEVEIRKDNGQITTLYDVENDWYVVRREEIGWRLKKGVLNALQVHMEEPTEMSGWTIGNVREVHTLLSGAASRVIADGPAEVRIRFEHKFRESGIQQDIVILPEERVIRFETNVDWREWGDFDRDAPMLKVSFSPDVQNATAVYEIPFGAIERPADDHEYPALGWVDASDGRHGFAILNDCKHGHRCRGNALELTLIRSGWLPDQKSDVGQHAFTYAILPHARSWREGGVTRAAQALGKPLTARPAAGEGAAFSLASLDSKDAILSGVKRSEDGKDLIARIYNPAPEPSDAVLTLGFDAASATFCDLLEAPEGERAKISSRKISLSLKPHEILTLRISR